MAEETKFPFRMYSAGGEGIITVGYHTESMEIIEITSGKVLVEIGTDTVEAAKGDSFTCLPRWCSA